MSKIKINNQQENTKRYNINDILKLNDKILNYCRALTIKHINILKVSKESVTDYNDLYQECMIELICKFSNEGLILVNEQHLWNYVKRIIYFTFSRNVIYPFRRKEKLLFVDYDPTIHIIKDYPKFIDYDPYEEKVVDIKIKKLRRLLTKTENKVFNLLINDKSQKEIMNKLSLSRQNFSLRKIGIVNKFKTIK